MSKILWARGWSGVVEVTAEEGDAVLAHRLIYHSSTPNRGTRRSGDGPARLRHDRTQRTEGVDLYPVEIPIARARP